MLVLPHASLAVQVLTIKSLPSQAVGEIQTPENSNVPDAAVSFLPYSLQVPFIGPVKSSKRVLKLPLNPIMELVEVPPFGSKLPEPGAIKLEFIHFV